MEKYEIEPYEENIQRDFEKEEAYLRAKKKLDEIVGFYWHLAIYIIVNLFLIIIIGSNLDKGESFWSIGTFATALFWGIGLAFHFFGVFGPRIFFSKAWEERKIKEYMNKDNEEIRRFE